MIWVISVLFFLAVSVLCGELFLRGFLYFCQKWSFLSLVKKSHIIVILTSLPIFMISSFSSVGGFYEIALGSALEGSITNILMGLGICAVIFIIKYSKDDIILKFGLHYNALLLLIFIIATVICGGKIGFGLSAFLLVAGIFFIIMNFFMQDDIKIGKSNNVSSRFPVKGLIFLGIGAAGAIIFSKLLLISIIEGSQKYGFSTKILASQIIGIGGRLPFLGICLIAAFKKQHQLLFRYIVESNIFLLSIVMGSASLFANIFEKKAVTIPLSTMAFELPFLSLSVILYLVIYKMKNKFGRITGLIFIFIYLLYILLQFNNV